MITVLTQRSCQPSQAIDYSNPEITKFCKYETSSLLQGWLFWGITCLGLLYHSKESAQLPNFQETIISRTLYIWALGGIYGTAVLFMGAFFTIAFCMIIPHDSFHPISMDPLFYITESFSVDANLLSEISISACLQIRGEELSTWSTYPFCPALL